VQRIAIDQAIRPAVSMAIKVDGFLEGCILFATLEERCLDRQTSPVTLTHCFDDGVGVDPLVDVQRNRRHFKRAALLFARPYQLRIKMRIVIELLAGLRRRNGSNIVVGLVCRRNRIGFRCYQANRRVVDSFLVSMLIALYRALRRLAAVVFPRGMYLLPLRANSVWGNAEF
jgi:hypothetical protein